MRHQALGRRGWGAGDRERGGGVTSGWDVGYVEGGNSGHFEIECDTGFRDSFGGWGLLVVFGSDGLTYELSIVPRRMVWCSPRRIGMLVDGIQRDSMEGCHGVVRSDSESG